jgi:hypothetical protein
MDRGPQAVVVQLRYRLQEWITQSREFPRGGVGARLLDPIARPGSP